MIFYYKYKYYIMMYYKKTNYTILQRIYVTVAKVNV